MQTTVWQHIHYIKCVHICECCCGNLWICEWVRCVSDLTKRGFFVHHSEQYRDWQHNCLISIDIFFLVKSRLVILENTKRQARGQEHNTLPMCDICFVFYPVMEKGRRGCSWSWHLGTWPGFPGWWWWQTTTGRAGPPPERWTASLLSSGWKNTSHFGSSSTTKSAEANERTHAGTRTQTHTQLWMHKKKQNYLISSKKNNLNTHTHTHRKIFNTSTFRNMWICAIYNQYCSTVCDISLSSSLYRPCPASSAARPCRWQRRWPTSGWEEGSDRSCRCAGVAGAAPCSHTSQTKQREQERSVVSIRLICFISPSKKIK